MDDGIGYEDIEQAVNAGLLVACIPGIRDGEPVVIVHATVVTRGQLPYVVCPIGKVRAGFALGHVQSLWRECEADGVKLAGNTPT